jgi:hypothetical protein
LSLKGRTQIINASDCINCFARNSLPGEEVLAISLGSSTQEDKDIISAAYSFIGGNVTYGFGMTKVDFYASLALVSN